MREKWHDMFFGLIRTALWPNTILCILALLVIVHILYFGLNDRLFQDYLGYLVILAIAIGLFNLLGLNKDNDVLMGAIFTLLIAVIVLYFLAPKNDRPTALIVPNENNRPYTVQTNPQGTERVLSPQGPQQSTAQVILPEGLSGSGILEIFNRNKRDATLKIIDNGPNKKVRAVVYVKARARVRVKGLEKGPYIVRFALEREWDRKSQQFMNEEQYYQLIEPVEFNQLDSEKAAGQIVRTITLDPAIETTIIIDPRRFNESDSA